MECPKCGFDLRDKDISHSDLGQWVHDELPCNFFWMDGDAFIYKRATKILRLIEEKLPHQGLKSSQRVILPLVAKGIECLISLGIVAEESGMFVIHTEPPYGQGHVTQVIPIGGHLAEDDLNEELSGARWKAFLSGEKIEDKNE